MTKLLLNLDEVAESLSFDRRTVERMIASGELPVVYPRPRSPRVRRGDLEDYVQGLSGPYTVTGPHTRRSSVCRRKTASTGAGIPRTGGAATSTEKGGGLAALLEYDKTH